MKNPIIKLQERFEGPDTSELDASEWDLMWRAQVQKSERTAWIVAGSAGVLALATIAGAYLKAPELQNELHVLTVNDAGVVSAITTLDGKEVLTQSEAGTIGDLAKFVKAYESYNYYSLSEPYALVSAMAGPDVARPYAKLYVGPEARQDVWLNKRSIDIQISSSVMNNRETGTVRYKKTETIDGKAKTTVHVATVLYGYYATDETPMEQRLLNPYGFRAIAYETTEEIGGAQ